MHKLMSIAHKTTTRLSNCVLALLIFFAFLSSTTNTTSKALEINGTNYIVSSENDLKDAITAINDAESGEYTITLNADITVEDIALTLEKNSVTIYGENHTLYFVKSSIIAKGNSTLNLGNANYSKTLSGRKMQCRTGSRHRNKQRCDRISKSFRQCGPSYYNRNIGRIRF